MNFEIKLISGLRKQLVFSGNSVQQRSKLCRATHDMFSQIFRSCTDFFHQYFSVEKEFFLSFEERFGHLKKSKKYYLIWGKKFQDSYTEKS